MSFKDVLVSESRMSYRIFYIHEDRDAYMTHVYVDTFVVNYAGKELARFARGKGIEAAKIRIAGYLIARGKHAGRK